MVLFSLGGRRTAWEEVEAVAPQKCDVGARPFERYSDEEEAMERDNHDRSDRKTATTTSWGSEHGRHTRARLRSVMSQSRSQQSFVLLFTEDAELQAETSGTLIEKASRRACRGACVVKAQVEDEVCAEGSRQSAFRRCLLPALMFGTTSGSAACIALVHRPALEAVISNAGSTQIVGGLLFLEALTLCCMMFSALTDPGQLSEEQLLQREGSMPERSHKVWQYNKPVRRFDHYCRWLANSIGLRNHREFFVMVLGLVVSSVLGALLDVALVPALYVRIGKFEWGIQAALLTHLVGSLVMAHYAVPILWLHLGFISRNELAAEWKEDSNYVVIDAVTGEVTQVDDLSQEEYDELFDAFVYDSSRNPWDKGFFQNWLLFWCTPRWSASQMGEF